MTFGRRRRRPLRGGAAALLTGLALAAALQAGPHVLVELADGRRIDAELYGFVNGRFFLRDRAGGKQEDIAETEVRSVDFGERADFTRPDLSPDPAQAMTVEDVRRLVERRAFLQLIVLLQGTLNRQGRPAALDLEARIARELERTDLTAAGRLDLELGRIALLSVLGEHDRADRAFARLRRDHKEEPAVRQFGRTVEGLRFRAGDRPGERRRALPPPLPPPSEGPPNAPPE